MEKKLLGYFTGPYLKYVKEMFTFRQDFTAGMVFCGDVSTSKCTNEISIREGSWFSGTHLSLDQVNLLL